VLLQVILCKSKTAQAKSLTFVCYVRRKFVLDCSWWFQLVTATSNYAQNHLTTHHKEHNTEKAFTYKFKPSFTGHSNTLDGLWKATAAKQPISKYESAKRRYFDSLPQLTEEVQELIEHHLLKLCACRLLPYSFVEWTELQELIDVYIPAYSQIFPHSLGMLPILSGNLRALCGVLMTVLPIFLFWRLGDYSTNKPHFVWFILDITTQKK